MARDVYGGAILSQEHGQSSYYSILSNTEELPRKQDNKSLYQHWRTAWYILNEGKYNSQPMAHNQRVDAEGHRGQFVSDHWWLPHNCDLCTLKHFGNWCHDRLDISSCALQNCVAHTWRLIHNERIWCRCRAEHIHPTTLSFKFQRKVC